jgi:tight adherence protein B
MTGVDWIAALLVFLAVALGVGSVALLWEGIRSYRRQRAASKALRRIHGEEQVEGPKVASSVLRDQEAEPGILGVLVSRLPHRADIQQTLEQGGIAWSVETFVLICLGAAAAFGLSSALLAGGLVIPAAFAAFGLFTPWFYVKRKKAKRIAAFEELFPEALDLLTRSIRAGHALNTGLKVVADESEEPLRTEFRQVYEEQRFGLPLDESLMGLADRVDLVDVRLFVTSVMIQKEAGGNLAEKLSNLSSIIRARFKFRRQVKIHTAHGRMTGTVIGVAPFVATFFLYMVNPDYMEPLFVEPAGRVMIAGAIFMMLMGYFAIRRITDIEY